MGPELLGAVLVGILFILHDWISENEDAEDEALLAKNVEELTSRLEFIDSTLVELGRTSQLQLGNLLTVGIFDAFDSRVIPNEPEYLRRFLSARETIDLIGLDLASVTKRFEFFADSFSPSVKHRVLLLDPRFPTSARPYLGTRFLEERQAVDMDAVENYCRRFAQWRHTLSPARRDSLSYEIRLAQCLPSTHYVRYDDEAFFGPYLMEKPSEYTFTLVTRNGSAIFDQLQNHFQAIWERWSVPPPSDWLT